MTEMTQLPYNDLSQNDQGKIKQAVSYDLGGGVPHGYL